MEGGEVNPFSAFSGEFAIVCGIAEVFFIRDFEEFLGLYDSRP